MWDRGKRAVTADPSSAADLLALDRLIDGADVLLVGTSGPGITYRGLIDRGRRPGQPCFWVAMPPYLLDETPWPGGRGIGGPAVRLARSRVEPVVVRRRPVDCLFPLALYMQGIWAAIVAVALLTGRQRGLALAPLAVAGGAHGAPASLAGQLRRGPRRAARPPAREVRAGRCRTTGPTAAPTASGCFSARSRNAFIERGLTAAGAGWIFDDPRVGGDPGNLRLGKNLTWVARELEKVFATRPRAEWLDLLEAADCPAAPVDEIGTWLDHDQVRALGLRLEAVSDTGQRVVMPGPLIDLSLTPVSVRGPAATSWPGITELRHAVVRSGRVPAAARRRPASTVASIAKRRPARRSRSAAASPAFACSTSARSSPARTSGRCSPISARTSSRSSGRRSAMSSGWRTAAAAVPASRCTTATSAARCSTCPAARPAAVRPPRRLGGRRGGQLPGRRRRPARHHARPAGRHQPRGRHRVDQRLRRARARSAAGRASTRSSRR